MNSLEIYIDGASKGNPGPAGIGVIICRNGEVIKNISRFIGTTTNNFAEYSALICGMEEALVLRADSLVFYTDSQLICRQIKKEYKVKSKNIVGLYNQAQRLRSIFKAVSIVNIPRVENRGADKLANLAIKKQIPA